MLSIARNSRSPSGERGLKYRHDRPWRHRHRSLPIRGAWIEIRSNGSRSRWGKASLPIRGAWIEIVLSLALTVISSGRSPSGERGLKCVTTRIAGHLPASLPIRGAWIEIRGIRCRSHRSVRSLPIRGAWIEMRWPCGRLWRCLSLPIRGAWIEIRTRMRESSSSMSLPIRGAWIEINPNDGFRRKSGKSLPIRGAWIEMCTTRLR